MITICNVQKRQSHFCHDFLIRRVNLRLIEQKLPVDFTFRRRVCTYMDMFLFMVLREAPLGKFAPDMALLIKLDLYCLNPIIYF